MRHETSPWATLRDTIVRQWGVVTLTQLREAGLGDGAIKAKVARGELVRLHREVLAVGHDVLKREGWWLAAVLTCGDGAGLSYFAAACHLGLWRAVPAVVDVTVPGNRRSQPGIRVHRPRILEPGDIVDHEGIPTTSPTRTVIDMDRMLARRPFERLVAEARHRELLDFDRLSLARSRRVRAIIGAPSQLTRSSYEQRFLDAVRLAGLPEPEANVWLTHGGGEEWSPDFLFRRERVIVEIDDDRHKDPLAFELDREKDAVRIADGWLPLRFTHRQIREDLAGRIALLNRTLASRTVSHGARS